MANSQASTPSLDSTLSGSPRSASPDGTNDIDLSIYPRIFVLPRWVEELDAVQLNLRHRGATVTDDVRDAQIILTAASKVLRVNLELRSRKVKLESTAAGTRGRGSQEGSSLVASRKRDRSATSARSSRPRKARRASTGSSAEFEAVAKQNEPDLSDTLSNDENQLPLPKPEEGLGLSSFNDKLFVKVVKVDWLKESMSRREVQPLEPYTLYEGTRVLLENDSASQLLNHAITASDMGSTNQHSPNQASSSGSAQTPESSIVSSSPARVQLSSPQSSSPHFSSRNLSYRGKARKPPLLRETTSEHKETERRITPKWVREHKAYACERATLAHPPNEGFINELRIIRHARELKEDKIGVRAYSTIIASVAAYPYLLESTEEVQALPGCDRKAVELFQFYKPNGFLEQAQIVQNDAELQVLDEFWKVHGVGPSHARKFYNQGFRTRNDLIMHAWRTLTRDQKIGLKYFDDFQLKIPRPESEHIARIVAAHAERLVGPGIQHMIVGGYRRGKPESGDVDIVLSHPDESLTLNLIDRLVLSLADAGFVRHVLEIHDPSSTRQQQVRPGNIRKLHHHGMDGLDKALCVWKNEPWEIYEPCPLKARQRLKEPKLITDCPHRRVDIIISPWKTVGCAVLGWTSGTTFQRDLRRYVREKFGWVFDGSGVRDEKSGEWVDVERYKEEGSRARTMLEAEKKACESMGLEWREGWERCTD